MGKINLVICLHNHQPSGNFDFVFEDAYKSSYYPFIDVYKEYKDIPIVLHYSGCLFDWIGKNCPEFIDILTDLVHTSNVELMGGGYFEPILPMLVERDRKYQIKRMYNYIKKVFKYEPQGFWLAERVWEQSLVSSLSRAGVKYTVVDDFHFKLAGLNEKDLFGYYISEDEGRLISVFNGSEKLRYMIPFSDPEKVIEYIYECSDDSGDRILVYADDGEKFGIWPGTYDLVYRRRWLSRFFDLLKDNRKDINVLTFRDVLKNFNPLGKIYLPDASYREMMEWALPSDTAFIYQEGIEKLKNIEDWDKYKLFYRGGIWRNFKVKYPEANLMYSKMIEVSEIVEASKSEQARKFILKAQCNCPYWHGIFGGLYLNHLRFGTYKNLIKAEKLARKEKFYYKFADIDFDGLNEIILSNEHIKLYLKPYYGGMIYEIDLFDKQVNIADNISRREETYHREIVESGAEKNEDDKASIHNLSRKASEKIKQALVYDRYMRKSLIDHVFSDNINLTNIDKCNYEEQIDFVNSFYDYKCKKSKEEIKLSLEIEKKFLYVRKNIIFKKNSSNFDLKYRLKNKSEEQKKFKFGVEFNYNFLTGDAQDRYYFLEDFQDKYKLNHKMVLKNTNKINFVDEWQNIKLNLTTDKFVDIFLVPIKTVSQSEGAYDLVYQSSAVFLVYSVNLEPENKFDFIIKHNIGNFK